MHVCEILLQISQGNGVGLDIHLYIRVFIKPLICQHNQQISLHLFSFNILLQEYVDLFSLCMSIGTSYLHFYLIVDDGWARFTSHINIFFSLYFFRNWLWEASIPFKVILKTTTVLSTYMYYHIYYIDIAITPT